MLTSNLVSDEVTLNVHGKDIKFVNLRPGYWIEGELRAGRYHELETLEYIRSLYCRGVYLDVGAYIGTHSLYVARYCNSDQVYALEPQSESLRCLVANIKANELSQSITPLWVAASDCDGEGAIRLPGADAGTAMLRQHCALPWGGSQPVKVIRLDSLGIRPKLIKIDVEGGELAVLRGASETLKTCDHVIVECWSRALAAEYCVAWTFDEVITLMHDAGFSLCRMLPYNTYHFSKAHQLPEHARPVPVNMLWWGKLGEMGRLACRSYLQCGHEVRLWTYFDQGGVPDAIPGVDLKDASEIVSFSDRERFWHPAQFADWFRYNLLYKRGGWWVDTDTVCLRRLPEVGGLVAVEDTFMYAQAGAEWIAACVARAELVNVGTPEKGGEGYYTAVSHIAVDEARFAGYLVEDERQWYGVEGLGWERFIEVPARRVHLDAYAIHWYRDLWRQAGTYGASQPEESIYGQMIKRYGA